MKILIWSQYFWPENFLINKLTSELCERGVEVTVITGKPNYPDGKILKSYKAWGIQREEYCGTEVIRIPIYPRGKNSLVGLFLNYMSFILMGYLLVPFLLRKRKFDAVFVYAPSPLLQALPAIWIAWLKNMPLFLWVQDLWPEALQSTGFFKNRWLLKLVEWFVRYIYRHSDSILIQSEAFRNPVQSLVSNKNKIRFFPNFSEDLSAKILPKIYSEAIFTSIHNHFSVVFAGNVGTVQSCETIVGAAELLQNYSKIKFYIVGTGSRFFKLEQEVKNKNLSNVVMVGHLPPEQMPVLFSVSSVLLLTLCDDSNLSMTIPSKLQHYLSAKKPIISSSNGESARLVIEANAGIACPAENNDALAQAVLKLFGMTSDELVQLGSNAYAYFKKNFQLKTQVDELLHHLRSVIEKEVI